VLRATLVAGAFVAGLTATSVPVAPSYATEAPTTTTAPAHGFYDPPRPLPAGKPGELIRVEEMPGAPDGARAWRILYHSRDRLGRDVAVSGMVLAPTAPGRGRPVVTWAHPTVGLVDTCAPTRSSDPFFDLPGLQQFLQAGYVLTATDYEGLGTPGVQPYLVGRAEAHNVLDAVRAAHRLRDAGAGTRYAIWGHSQGGQASLFAGQLARSYAPELRLVGVAAAAPAAELKELLIDDAGDAGGIAFTSYALATWPRIYPRLSTKGVLTPEGVAAFPQLTAACIEEAEVIAAELVGKFFARSPLDFPPWPRLLTENTPGKRRTGASIFVAQGTADTTVLPATTEQLVRRLCRLRDTVELKLYPGVTHPLIGFAAAADVAAWITGRFDGAEPAPSTC
jgi:acetyl esterase/lipase